MISETFQKADMPRMLALLAGFISTCDESKSYTLEIKERKQKRSLDANAYFWVLAHKIAEASGIEVSTVYRSYIREIGGNNDLVCVRDKAVDAFCEGWERNGLGWIAEPMPSKLNGCTNVMCYYGSSTYDTAQMSRLIDMAVQDCKEYGIEYMPENEIEKLLEMWGENSVR